MIEAQVLDIGYHLDYDKSPIISIYGKTAENRSVTVNVMNFRPYFYVLTKEDSIENVHYCLRDDMHLDVEVVKRFKPIGYQREPTTMLKVTCISPKDVRFLRDTIRNISGVLDIMEGDILFHNRFAADRDITGMSWIRVPEQSVDYHKVERIIELRDDAPLKILSFDIECLSPESLEFPNAEKDPVILISLAFNTVFMNVKNLVIIAKDIVCDRPDTIVCKNEKEVLQTFREIMRDYDPDIVTGFNIVEFDIPYINVRMIANELSPVFGRDGSLWKVQDKMGKKEVLITGRVIMDSLPMVRRNFSLKNYKLKTVAKELLHLEKLDVEPKEMREYWFDEGEKFIDFVKYSRRDAVLGLSIIEDLGLLKKYIEISKISGVFLQVAINDNQTPRIESLLLREFIKEKRVFPLKPINPDDETGVKGAYVLDVVQGLHENVIICDFASLYPSIIRAFNISWDTILDEPQDDIIITPNNAYFLKHEKLHGILPRILAWLYEERVATKKLMKAATEDKDREYYDHKQYAIKIMLNSFYGYSGNTKSRLFDERIANAITSVGRDTILKTKNIIENMEFEVS